MKPFSDTHMDEISKNIAKIILSEVYPKTCINFSLIRVGRNNDGGYVMVDDFKETDCLISYGIGGDVSFEKDLQNKIKLSHLYDHTIQNLPDNVKNSIFYKEEINSTKIDKTCDIEKSLKKLPDEKDFILKCDIEGSEWDILESCNEEDLSKFRQIVIEFHHFIQSNNSDVLDKYLNVLKKINKTHQSINVHGNNCGPWSFKKMDLPNVLEITYLRKTDYEFKNFDKELTEKYNMPNCPKKPEMIFLKSEYLIK